MRKIIAVVFAFLLLMQIFGLVCKIQPVRADAEEFSTSPISPNPQDGDSKITQNDQETSGAQSKTVQHRMNEGELQLLKTRTGIGEKGQNYNQLVYDHGTGLAPPSEEEWKLIEEGAIVIDQISTTVQYFPSSWDNTASSWFPPIGNQGSQASCVAWAVGYYTKTFQEAKEHNWNVKSGAMQNKITSPSFIYNLINYGVDGGSYYSDAIGLICSVGASSLGTMLYNADDYTSWPSELAWKEAPLYRANASSINLYMMLQDDAGLANLKTWLSSGNLAIVSVDAYKIVDPFWGWSRLDGNDMLTLDNYVNPSTNHAGTIVGYNDNIAYTEEGQTHYGAFKIANSWGIPLLPSPFGWEHICDGCYWISYEAMKQRISYCTIYSDILDYTPELVATFGIGHNKRGECSITVGAGNTNSPIVTKSFDSYVHGGSVPFCWNDILFDITEFKNVLAKTYDQQYFLQVYDGDSITVGTVTKFAINHAQSNGTPLYTLNNNFVTAYVTLTKIMVPDDYPTIQAAIDSSWPGDEIFVKAGTYYENIIVNKAGLSLIGESRDNTVIDGGHYGSIVQIDGAHVTVSNFLIRNPAWDGIIINANYASIHDNTISDAYEALQAYGSGNNAQIYMNNVANSTWGILLSGSSNSTIFENNISNIAAAGIGISSSGNVVYSNNLTSNGGGFQIIDSARNSIYRNNIVDNAYGVYLETSPNNTIYENKVMNNVQGIEAGTLGDPESEGAPPAPGGDGNVFRGNMIIGNNAFGLKIHFSSNNVIAENTITSNGDGIHLYSDYFPSVYHNNVINNLRQTYVSSPSSGTWDDGYPSGGNYWSDYVGADSNGDGIGDQPYVMDANNRDRYPLMQPWPIFKDGFESSSFSAWSGSSVSNGETATVSSSAAHNGRYSARFTGNGGGGIENAVVTRSLISLSEVYARGYFRVTQNGIADDNDRFYFIVLQSTSGNNIAYAGWRRTAGSLRWCLVTRNGAGYVTVYSSTTPALNRWYSMEVHWRYGNPGLGELYVDSVRVCTTSGNTASYGYAGLARYGLTELFNCGPTAAYADCVVISGSYIGPEPGQLFSSGFEGSFTGWSLGTLTTGETRSVTTTLRHHGSYSASLYSNGGGGTERSYVYRAVTASSELYLRGYVRVSQNGIVQVGDRVQMLSMYAGSNTVAYGGWRRTSSGLRWFLTIRSGTGTVTAYSTSAPALNTWYGVEMHWRKGSTDGLGELWVNGAKVCSLYARNTGVYGDATQVRVGLPEVYLCGATRVYLDCVSASRSYIGPE